MSHVTNSQSAPIVNYLGPNKIPVAREDYGLLLDDFSAYVSTLTSGVKHMYIFKSFNLRKLPSKAKQLDIIDNKLKWKQEFLQVCRLFKNFLTFFFWFFPSWERYDWLHSNIFHNKVLRIHIFYSYQFPLWKDLGYLSKDMCSFKWLP